MNLQRVEELVRELLVEIGEDPNREGSRKPPARGRSLRVSHVGLPGRPERIVNSAVFESHANNMIISGHRAVQPVRAPYPAVLRGLPYRYVAQDRLIGLSKLSNR